MLPTGHVAGGYLTAKIAASINPSLSANNFFAWTVVFAFLPDLDYILAFARNGKAITSEKENHHRYLSHTPVIYLLIFLIWLFLFPQSKVIAISFLLGTFSHFILDSFSAEGILWLWPLNKKLYSLQLDPKVVIVPQSFFRHWLQFIKEYAKVFSFRLEVILIFIALLTFIIS